LMMTDGLLLPRKNSTYIELALIISIIEVLLYPSEIQIL
jgi:hypothetical protein